MAKRNLTKTQAKKIALDAIGNFSLVITDTLTDKEEWSDGTWTEDDFKMITEYVDSICDSLLKRAEKL